MPSGRTPQEATISAARDGALFPAESSFRSLRDSCGESITECFIPAPTASGRAVQADANRVSGRLAVMAITPSSNRHSIPVRPGRCAQPFCAIWPKNLRHFARWRETAHSSALFPGLSPESVPSHFREFAAGSEQAHVSGTARAVGLKGVGSVDCSVNPFRAPDTSSLYPGPNAFVKL